MSKPTNKKEALQLIAQSLKNLVTLKQDYPALTFSTTDTQLMELGKKVFQKFKNPAVETVLEGEAQPVLVAGGAKNAAMMMPFPIKAALLLQLKTDLEKLLKEATDAKYEKKLAETALKNLSATKEEQELAEAYLKNLQAQDKIYQQIVGFSPTAEEDKKFVQDSKKAHTSLVKKCQKLEFLIKIQNNNLTDADAKKNFSAAADHLNKGLESWQNKVEKLETKLATAKPDKIAEIQAELTAAKKGKDTLEQFNTKIAELLNDPTQKIAIATTKRFDVLPATDPTAIQTTNEWFDKYDKYTQMIAANPPNTDLTEMKAWVKDFELHKRINPTLSRTNCSPTPNLGVMYLDANGAMQVAAQEPANSDYLHGTIIHELVHARQAKDGKIGFHAKTGNMLEVLYDQTDEMEAFEAEFYANSGKVYITGEETNWNTLKELQARVAKAYSALPTTDKNADMTLQALGWTTKITAYCRKFPQHNAATLLQHTLRDILQGNVLQPADLLNFKTAFNIGKIF